MKSSLLCLIIATFSFLEVSAQTYYVSTTGNNSNSGLTEALAWKSISYSASSESPVTAGDTVYVEAGDYGAENVVISKSGTPGLPISFIGYKNTPGDAPPLLVNSADPYAAFVSIDMPTFNGANRATAGIGFNCADQNYLIIKNFQIENYAYGFVAGGTSQDAGNIEISNINVMNIGDINADYAGLGILFGSMGTRFSNANILANCLVVNAAAEGFGIYGNSNTITGCRVYCNENTASASTDYYVIVCGDYNTISYCYIERTAGLSHSGHGYSLKSNAEQVIDQGLTLPVLNPQHNKVQYCVARNMGESFCVRHRGVQYNLFYHCKAIGTHTGVANSPGGQGNCVVIRDGASNNIFDGCIAENCAAGFVIGDSVEDGDGGTNPPGHPGNNNLLINCVIYNCYVGVNFTDNGVQSDAGDNTIANCTFYKTRYLHYAGRHCANMKYIGNIYYGCLPDITGGYFRGNAYASDIIPDGTNTYFRNCDFINIQGGMPTDFVSSSVGSLELDPIFMNAGSLDFHLDPSSPCIDASIDLPTVVTDFDSVVRPQGISSDMGAFEFLSLSASVSSSPVSCNGGDDGTATVTVNGGTPTYTYSWSNGQTTASASGLIAGVYSVTVSDANANTIILSATINEPVALECTFDVTDASTCIATDGALSALVAGGTQSYTYSWSTVPIQITSIATGLGAGQYTVTVTDAHGCLIVSTASVSCSTSAIEQLQEKITFNIFPNPTTGLINITVVTKQTGKEMLIEIRDLLGRDLYSQSFVISNNSQAFAIDLSKILAPGSYVMMATFNGRIYEKRIVLQ